VPVFPPVGAPRWKHFQRIADEWPKTVGPKYGDGGQDTFWGGGQPTRRWTYTVEGMSRTEADLFAGFVTDTRGGHLGCTFTYRDGVVWANVKIESYECGHGDRTNGYKNGHFYRFTFIKTP
jgi:hypothetical protein